MVAAAACGSALGLVKTLNYGFQVFAEFFVSGTVAGVAKIGKTWSDGEGVMQLAEILTLGGELTFPFSLLYIALVGWYYDFIVISSRGSLVGNFFVLDGQSLWCGCWEETSHCLEGGGGGDTMGRRG